MAAPSAHFASRCNGSADGKDILASLKDILQTPWEDVLNWKDALTFIMARRTQSLILSRAGPGAHFASRWKGSADSRIY